MDLFGTYIFDLDGTVYLGDALLPTAGDTIRTLRQLDKQTLFLSNNPTRSRSAYAAKLSDLGLPTEPHQVINSSYVMVSFLAGLMPGARLFVVGEGSLLQELSAAGFELAANGQGVDAVIASFDRTFTYSKLQHAFDAIRSGARFFATNADRFCPVPGGGEPDAASMIAAIEACTSRQVEEVVGKPSHHMAQTILDAAGTPADQCLMVGDRLETDVLMGINAGMSTALALTGATSREAVELSDIKPTYLLSQLQDLISVGG